MQRSIEYIERKSMLYKTGVEYGDYTMNHVLGCSHGCLYPCYAYLMAKRFGKVLDYKQWCQPKLVSNALELLDYEIPKYKSQIKSVHLCFTTDPFMNGYEDIGKISMEAIKKINCADIPCTILTKGLLPLELADQSSKNVYGITLISLDENYRKMMEPGASSYSDRISSLKVLHDKGCKTWVSIEPYPTPNLKVQDLNTILNEVSFANRIIFGRTHYSKEITKYKKHKEFYNQQSEIVIDFCTKKSIDYHIKHGTIT